MYDDIVKSIGSLAITRPDRLLYTFLRDGADDAVSWTCGHTDVVARTVASNLQARHLGGERVIIALPSGLDYLAAVLGCLYAGVIAVPTPAQAVRIIASKGFVRTAARRR